MVERLDQRPCRIKSSINGMAALNLEGNRHTVQVATQVMEKRKREVEKSQSAHDKEQRRPCLVKITSVPIHHVLVCAWIRGGESGQWEVGSGQWCRLFSMIRRGGHKDGAECDGWNANGIRVPLPSMLVDERA